MVLATGSQEVNFSQSSSICSSSQDLMELQAEPAKVFQFVVTFSHDQLPVSSKPRRPAMTVTMVLNA